MTSHSAPDAQPAAGLATLTGIAAIGNPRNVSGRRFILDAQIYIGSEKCESLIGALSYYNMSDIAFDSDKVALYFIYSTFAKFEMGADIHPTKDSPPKYDFVGDIQWIVPLTVPSEDTDSSSFAIDPCWQPPYLHVSGVAMNCHKQQGTFDVDVEHYISSLKDVKSDKAKPIKPCAPIFCFFPDSPRYKQEKPVPYAKRYVAVAGFLTDVTYAPNSDDQILRFHLKVELINFLGVQSGPSTTIPNSLDSPLKTPSRNHKGFISYRGKQTLTASPATPSTPTPPQGSSRKRARTDDTDANCLAISENLTNSSQ